MGPLRICEENRRYFADDTGKPVLMTGFHTWNNLVDMGPNDPPMPFEFDRYIETMRRLDQNFIRLWSWDMVCMSDLSYRVGQFPWKRTGPGLAIDGKPRFDLELLDETYLKRLRQRVDAAREKGIYVCVMFFEGWCVTLSNKAPIDRHCFAGDNNINGIDITASADGECLRDWVTLDNPEVLKLQKRTIQKVVEGLNDCDNVLYEIANEAGPASHDWQDHLVLYVKELERTMPLQHPVGQSGGMGTHDRRLFEGPADWVAPDCNSSDGFATEYRRGEWTWGRGLHDLGDRPVFLDTDHLWGIGGNVPWAWKSFCRGYNLLYMDRVDDFPSAFWEHEWWKEPTNLELRSSLGALRKAAARLDLSTAVPMSHLSSTAYCLAEPGEAYLVYQPAKEGFSLLLETGSYTAEWLNPITGSVIRDHACRVEKQRTSFNNDSGGDAVLALRRSV